MDAPKPFSAHWIGPAYDPRADFGLHIFLRTFEVEALPETFVVRVSADQRYALHVNGQLVARGPQRGDVAHWFYETLDLAPFLQVGLNHIEARVTHLGWIAPMAQHTARCAFLMEADAPYAHVSTPFEWQVATDYLRDFQMMNASVGEYYIDVGPGEVFRRDMERGPKFRAAHAICRAERRGEVSGGSPWSLIPRTLPMERLDDVRRPHRVLLRRKDGDVDAGPAPWSVGAGESLLLDFGEIVCGYPEFRFGWSDGSMNRNVRIVYAESLVDANGDKGHREATEGKNARGYEDLVFLHDSDGVAIIPTWLRTARYVELVGDEGFRLDSVQLAASGYPLVVEASFECDDPEIQAIWDVCVRTLRLCAGETYYDCPHYEQLQYGGDTRLQALIGYYLSSDRRLQRNAIEQIHWSLMENGLTQSRYPSRQMQVIPPFSLWWVVMLYDAWMHDPGFDPSRYVDSAKGVIRAYEATMNAGAEPFWCFGDWLPEWKWGVPPGGPNAEMHMELLHLARWTLGQLAGEPIDVAPLIAHPETEHGYALSRYRHWLAGMPLPPWDESLVEGKPRCGLFWSYIKHVAMDTDDFGALLDPWREALRLGLTTTPETGEPTRSDCHGWSAHPPLGLLQLVAGVTSAAPGWQKARIAPKAGRLTRFVATIPHPEGDIVIRYADQAYSVECPVEYEFLNDFPSS